MENIAYNSLTDKGNYKSELNFPESIWIKDANNQEYKKLFVALANYTRNEKLRFIISDLHLKGFVSVEDVKWLDEEILKKAIILGVEKIALTSERSIYYTAYADFFKCKFGGSAIKVQFFDDFTMAKYWLTAN